MKKAISVLLSWVLIIGFAVAMSAIIFTWAIPFVTKVSNNLDNSNKADVYCGSTAIKIQDICRRLDNSSITIKLENTGSYNIKRLTIARETTRSSLQSCYLYDLGLTPITPGITFSSDLAMLASFTDQKGNPLDCIKADPNQQFGLGDYVTDIEIVPWINVEDKDVPCVDKRVTAKDINILNHWCI